MSDVNIYGTIFSMQLQGNSFKLLHNVTIYKLTFHAMFYLYISRFSPVWNDKPVFKDQY